jgi:hypothetical protein
VIVTAVASLNHIVRRPIELNADDPTQLNVTPVVEPAVDTTAFPATTVVPARKTLAIVVTVLSQTTKAAVVPVDAVASERYVVIELADPAIWIAFEDDAKELPTTETESTETEPLK